MGRKKASVASADAQEENAKSVVNGKDDDGAVNGQPRRSGRKRTGAATLVEPEEPVVKKGRASKTKVAKKDEVDVKQEASDEVPTAGRKGSQKKPKVKEEKKKIEVKEEVVDDSEPSVSQASSSSKSKKKGKKIKEEEAEEATKPTKAPGGKALGGKSKRRKSSGKENSDSSNIPSEQNMKKSGAERVVVVKGCAAVDALCPIAASAHVLEEDNEIWDCMLNQTNIQFNNNKFYLIQLLKDDNKDAYSVWMRWGRVGANGQNSLQPCGGDLVKAKKIFEKKFCDKTKNEWADRDAFEKVPGKYDLLAMDYSRDDTTDSAAAEINKKMKEERKKIESKLDIRVRALIEIICDVRIMEETVLEMKYDAQKAPLGKLTTDQIKAGYAALKKIDDLILKGKFTNMELVHACNDFYTRIPHYFGMKVPPLIKTKVEIQEKVALLEALGDIQAALSIMDQPIDVNVHPVDQHYSGLKCDIIPLDKNSADFKTLENYLFSTHAKTHSNYKMELMEVFICKKEMEYERFKDVGNRMLLWHGSRLSNWAGILSQGLRIAPPEAPVTGYMFGKGIYFADMASKSANYCWATQRNNIGFLALSEVALGKTNDLLSADYNANKLPAGCHSVKGCGRCTPVPENFTKLSDGTVVPMGPGKELNISNPRGYSLLYNEYIVYNPAQVRTRFLLKVKFHFR